MKPTESEKLKYPIGLFIPPDPVTEIDIQNYISEIEKLPDDLRKLVSGFSNEQLNTNYRNGGWTVKQVIHHIADSHMNAFIRFKLALTEDMPTIRPYFEDRWAELGDYKNTDINISLDFLDSLHQRWVILLRSMSSNDFDKIYFHPEHGTEFSLGESSGMYSWHGRHHYSHIFELKKAMKW